MRIKVRLFAELIDAQMGIFDKARRANRLYQRQIFRERMRDRRTMMKANRHGDPLDELPEINSTSSLRRDYSLDAFPS